MLPETYRHGKDNRHFFFLIFVCELTEENERVKYVKMFVKDVILFLCFI
jgi:hypothetical protein